ncbi:MAG: flagellar basal body rod protein FlgB [Blastocatellia bacterium]
MINNNDQITNLLNSFLDIQSQRTQIIASNLANADTPGFNARELDFKEFLYQAAQETINQNNNLLSKTELKVVNQKDNPMGIDRNNVDTAKEMSSLADAAMQYMTGTQLLKSRWQMIRLAIREGK